MPVKRVPPIVVLSQDAILRQRGIMGGSFLQKYNYFEDQAYGRFWW